MSLSLNLANESAIMIDFTEQNSVDNWRITNDGVMGGESSGRFLCEPDKGIFVGDISIDNNGGFSSVSRLIPLLANTFETVTIDIIGDGLIYELRMVVMLDGYRLPYKYSFNTVAGQREKLTFTLAGFQASFRGRIITDAPMLEAENIYEVGFLVKSKVACTFSLTIFSLHFE